MEQIIITNIGNEKLNAVMTSGELINFSKAVLSSYDYTGVDLKALTNVLEIKQTSNITTINENGQTLLNVAFSNKNIRESFNAKLVGFYVDDILYGVYKINEIVSHYNGEEVITTFVVNTEIDNNNVYFKVASDTQTAEKVLQLTNNFDLFYEKFSSLTHHFTIPYTEIFAGWQSGNDAPYSTYDGSGVRYKDKIYLFGGNASPYNQTSIYSTLSKGYIVGASAPRSTYGSSAVLVQDKVHIFGGSVSPYNFHQVYDIGLDSWEDLGSIPLGVDIRDCSSVYDEESNCIFIFGCQEEPYKQTIMFNLDTNEWTILGNSLYSTRASSCVKVMRDVYIFGGSEGLCNQVQKFNLDSKVFSYVTVAPKNIQYSSCVYHEKQNCVYVFGGNTAPHTYIQIYYIDEDRWASGVTSQKSLRASVSLLHGEHAYIFGGSVSPSNYLQIYSLVELIDDRGVLYSLGEFKKGDTIYCSSVLYDNFEKAYTAGVVHTLARDVEIKTFVQIPSRTMHCGWYKRGNKSSATTLATVIKNDMQLIG